MCSLPFVVGAQAGVRVSHTWINCRPSRVVEMFCVLPFRPRECAPMRCATASHKTRDGAIRGANVQHLSTVAPSLARTRRAPVPALRTWATDGHQPHSVCSVEVERVTQYQPKLEELWLQWSGPSFMQLQHWPMFIHREVARKFELVRDAS